MVKTTNAYDDVTGNRELSTYEENNVYTISDSLLRDFLHDNVAIVIDESQPEENKVDAPKETKRGKKAK